MNPSHNPILNIADPLRAPSETRGVNSSRSSGERARDSFNTLYYNETASLDKGNRTNISDLDGGNTGENISAPAQKDTSNAADTQLRTEQHEKALVVDEPILQGKLDEYPALVEHDSDSKDQAFETELLHGMSIALPSNSPQTEVGEKFPLGGKELPPSGEPSGQELLLARTTTESERRGVVARADTVIQIQGRGDTREGGVRLRQAKVFDLPPTRSDSSMNEQRLEMAQSRILFEPQTEGLTPFASKALQEPSNAVAASNNFPANHAAVAPQIDTLITPKLSLQANTDINTGLNASGRSGNFDWSNALGEKVRWMRNANISIAELHLHPAELGSIEIKIVTEDQLARISFITSSAAARDIIEESLPKLRDSLADSGLELDQSDISQKENGDKPARQDQQTLPNNQKIEREMEHEFTASPISPRIGQVDRYV